PVPAEVVGQAPVEELAAAPPAREAVASAPVDVEVPLDPEIAPVETAPVIELPAEDDSVVEICFALYQQQRFSEVIDRAADALTAGPDGRPLTDPQEKAALWSIVALARQALGEDTGARTALENAIAVAPDSDRPTYQRQLASLAESVAQGLLAEAQRQGSPDSDDCLGMIRSAVAWLERGATAAPA